MLECSASSVHLNISGDAGKNNIFRDLKVPRGHELYVHFAIKHVVILFNIKA